MRPRTQAFDDQVRAVLHEHGGVTAMEIARTLAGRVLHSTEIAPVQLSLRRMQKIGLVASEPIGAHWLAPASLSREVIYPWRHGNQLVWRAVEPLTDLSDLLGVFDGAARQVRP